MSFWRLFTESVSFLYSCLYILVIPVQIRDKARGDEKQLQKFVLSCQKTIPMQSLLGYHFDEVKEFVKIHVALPSLIPGIKRCIDEGVGISGIGTMRGQVYESNVPLVLRFMIDNEIQGADWVSLPAATYSVRDAAASLSRCTLEVDVVYNHIEHHECTGVYSAIAPLRILSFDIECQGRKGHFPDAQFDPVIQIAT